MKNSPIPISAKCPYSVSMVAMLNYMWIEINHASFSLNCLCKVSLHKCWSSAQSLNYYVHVSTLFFQSNEAVSKFFRDCLAGCSGQDGSSDNKRIFFLVFLIPLKWISKFCFAHYVVVSQKRNSGKSDFCKLLCQKVPNWC